MFFIVIFAVSITLAVWPTKMSLLGRTLSVYSALSSLVFGVANAGYIDEMGLGSLGDLYDYSARSALSVQVTASLFFLLAVFISFCTKDESSNRPHGESRLRVPQPVISVVIALSLIVGIYLLLELGFETIYSYSGYQTIKNLGVRFDGNQIGRFVASIYRPLVMLVIVVAVISHGEGKRVRVFLSAVSILIAFSIGIAEASRITSLYCVIFAAGYYLIGFKRLSVLWLVAALVLVAYSLEARNHQDLGVAYFFQYTYSALTENVIIKSLISNLFGSLFVTSATVNSGFPSAYSEAYKVLSFLPSLGALDGFQEVRSLYEQRVSFSIPFNSFGESWVFGSLYYAFFWLVIFVSARIVSLSKKFGLVFYVISFGVFLLGLMYASQYTVRTSIRFFYLVIVLYLLLSLIRSSSRGRKRSANGATEGDAIRK